MGLMKNLRDSWGAFVLGIAQRKDLGLRERSLVTWQGGRVDVLLKTLATQQGWDFKRKPGGLCQGRALAVQKKPCSSVYSHVGIGNHTRRGEASG